jgi:hypothetical protein
MSGFAVAAGEPAADSSPTTLHVVGDEDTDEVEAAEIIELPVRVAQSPQGTSLIFAI